MKPIRDNILFKPFKGVEKTESGIYIPDSCQKISDKGLIVAVGNGTSKKPMKLKAGEVGYRVKAWGQEVLVDGELHFLMNQDAVIAIQ